MLDKSKILAITKCDMMDDEMLQELRKDLPDLPTILISSVAEMNLDRLKRMLWEELQVVNKEEE